MGSAGANDDDDVRDCDSWLDDGSHHEDWKRHSASSPIQSHFVPKDAFVVFLVGHSN